MKTTFRLEKTLRSPLLVLIITQLLLQCKSGKEVGVESGISQKPLGNNAACNGDIENVAHFREIFYHIAKHKVDLYPNAYFPTQMLQKVRNGHQVPPLKGKRTSNKLRHNGYRDVDIDQMIFTPPKSAICLGEKVGNRRKNETKVGYLKRMESTLAIDNGANTTEQYYDQHSKTSVQSLSNTRNIFNQKGPVTIVVIPGFIAEFFDPIPFEQVMKSQNSIFRGRLNSPSNTTLPSKSVQDIIKSLPSESVWSNSLYQQKNVPMEKLIQVSSLDSDQKSLVNLIFLPSPRGSLETIGKTEDVAKKYLKRLNKFFDGIRDFPRLVKQTKNLYFMGYSRGHLTALDLIVRLKNKPPWWIHKNRLKGMINLAGVVYGTSIADDALVDTTSGTYQLLEQVKKSLDDLKGADDISANTSAKDKAKIMTDNTKILKKLITKIGVMLPEPDPRIAKEKALVDSTQNILAKLGTSINPLHIGSLLGSIHKNVIKIGGILNPHEHFKEIARRKKFFDRLIVGLRSMTKAGRVAWYEQNTLPDINYFSITGSMPDKFKKENRTLLDNPGYSASGVDFQILRGNYYTTLNQTGLQVNDSQVTYPMARFWPNVFTILNSEQDPVKSYYMGMVGTHHWGIAWNSAFHQNNGRVNGFPKALLLESLATFVLEKQAN